MYRKILIFLIIAVALSSCAKQQAGEKISETRLLLDTYCTITIYSTLDEEAINDILDRAFEMCLEYEELFSITIEGSDVWRINHAGGEPIEISSHTVEVIKAGIEFGELSGGLFDITIGRLSRLWDFSNIDRNRNVPEAHEIDAAKSTIDYRQVNINGNFVHIDNPDAWIDLGAIAKGYIADRIAEFLIYSGINDAVIELGGDVVTIGKRPDGGPWQIGIRDWTAHLLGVIDAAGTSVVSSGTYERMFEKDGVNYHHILDPRTGMPVDSDIISATVITENALIGEGLSTIAILMGSEKIQAFFEQVDGYIGAVVVLDGGVVLTLGDLNYTDMRSDG